jgi:tyrosyl-tRNA synthetase
MKPAHDQFEHITRTVDVSLPEGGLLALLEQDRPLRVKLGVDPTAPDVTLGWAVVFDLLRRFQEMGHTAVLIVGDFTAQVGDPSEAASTRRRLDAGEVRDYADDLLPTVRELLLPEPLEVRFNSEWLGGMDMHDVLDLTSAFTVARIMDRDDFSKRWEANEPVFMIEFMYPLLQAMDSVAVGADIEIGGTDQLWNLLVGRDLQERRGGTGQVVVTAPLLVGTDGVKKMSQSIGNYISVRDPADEMFGKVMSIPDQLMPDWYLLAAGADREEVAAIESGLEGGALHPGEVKRELGRRIVARYWDEASATGAEVAFDRLFREKEIPDDLQQVSVGDALGPDGMLSLPIFLEAAQLVTSRSEARRLIAQGAVKVNGERVDAELVAFDPEQVTNVQVGKRRFARAIP